MLLALLSGLLNIAIFPRIDQGWLALVCFVPLFWLVRKETPRKLFLYFWLAGVVFRVGNLYWIVHVIQHYSQLHTVVAAAIVFLLCVFLGLFWGITGFLLALMRNRVGFGWAMLAAPFLWVVFESLINALQFPWDLTGYSVYKYLPISQLASIVGVYGLTWLIVAWNAALTDFLVRRNFYYIGSITAIVLISGVWGYWRISQPINGPELKVGLIQGNIPQDVKINYEFAAEVNDKHVSMTKSLANAARPEIIFWPEASTLFPIQEGGEWTQEIVDAAKQTHIPLFIGSDAYIQDRVYNSAFLVDSNGQLLPLRYSKMYLVPFGEYVPFQKLLFFAGKVVPEISDFTAGETHTLFPLNGRKFAVNICFEVVFPQLSRTFVRNGATLLTTITNDAWFGKSCAPYQHFAMAVMRAIENRRYLVRAANTGISGIVDPYGRVLQRTDIFVPAVMSGKVQWIDETTFYTRLGDIVVYVSLVVAVIVLFFCFRSPVRQNPEAVSL
jgi:apolipoprotein N-acyltransferase